MARKKNTKSDRNTKKFPSVDALLHRIQSTADGSKPKLGKLFDSCTSKVDSEPPHGSNVDIPHIHECKQTLSLSAETSARMVSQKMKSSAMTSVHNSSGLKPQCQMTFDYNRSSLKPQCQTTFEQNGSSLAPQCQQKFIKQLRQ
ncbi:hypothetical protein Tco_0004297 [Tanacetum coccineum]